MVWKEEPFGGRCGQILQPSDWLPYSRAIAAEAEQLHSLSRTPKDNFDQV